MNAVPSAASYSPGAGSTVPIPCTWTVKQLQTLAKQNGITIARTKADFIKLLDAAEPDIPHGDLGARRSRPSLPNTRSARCAARTTSSRCWRRNRPLSNRPSRWRKQVAQLPPTGGLHELTFKDLQEMAKSKGISLNMTKQDVVELLDQIEPGVDHRGLSGNSLIAAKQKLGVGVLKNKQQLAHAVEKAAGQGLAENAKQRAHHTDVNKTVVAATFLPQPPSASG